MSKNLTAFSRPWHPPAASHSPGARTPLTRCNDTTHQVQRAQVGAAAACETTGRKRGGHTHRNLAFVVCASWHGQAWTHKHIQRERQGVPAPRMGQGRDRAEPQSAMPQEHATMPGRPMALAATRCLPQLPEPPALPARGSCQRGWRQQECA